MHSRRMHTARFGGQCEQNDWTDRFKNITLPQTLFADSIKSL